MQIASYIHICTLHITMYIIVKFHKFAVLVSYIMLRCLMLQSLDAKLDVHQLLQMTHLATLKQSLPITKKHQVTCESSEVYFVHPAALHILIK